MGGKSYEKGIRTLVKHGKTKRFRKNSVREKKTKQKNKKRK